ncbi:MAG: helix-turn-helix domain-containing protein [Patescibacteria group bacterium]|nr:helix-turn-helix domain-containing protein [Patescibacteria group bacterium]
MLDKTQKEQVTKALLQLGLLRKEATVYIAALQQDESSIITLAKKSGLSRGTVYDVVEKLKEKGYLAEIKKGKKRRLLVESPTNRFYSLLDKKQEDLEKAKKVIDGILPVIKGINASEEFKPQIRVYEGEKGFHKVWDEILQYNEKSYLSIAKIETFVKFAGEGFLEQLQKRKAKLGFSSRVINEDSPLSRKMMLADKTYKRESKLAPKEFGFPSTEIIYGDKIAMFSTRKENIVVVIESQDFAQTHRAYFEMMWKFLETYSA